MTAPLVLGDDGLYNVNGDSISASIAEALKAEKLMFLTDVAGVMRNPQNLETLISVLTVEESEELITQNIIKGGMLPKVKAGISAIKKGVTRRPQSAARRVVMSFTTSRAAAQSSLAALRLLYQATSIL